MDMHGNPIVIRSKTFKAWLNSNFTKQELNEMVMYGVKSGYYGLIDHRDLSKIYCRFKDEIQECLSASVWSLAAFTERVDPWNMEALEEELTWYAAEALAWELVKEQ